MPKTHRRIAVVVLTGGVALTGVVGSAPAGASSITCPCMSAVRPIGENPAAR